MPVDPVGRLPNNRITAPWQLTNRGASQSEIKSGKKPGRRAGWVAGRPDRFTGDDRTLLKGKGGAFRYSPPVVGPQRGLGMPSQHAERGNQVTARRLA